MEISASPWIIRSLGLPLGHVKRGVATDDVGVVRLYVDGVCCTVAAIQDGLTFMARVLRADANLQSQRALVGLLLLAPVPYLVGAVIRVLRLHLFVAS